MTLFGSGEKRCRKNYRLDIIFSITRVKDQLVLPEGYSKIPVERYWKKDANLHTMSAS